MVRNIDCTQLHFNSLSSKVSCKHIIKTIIVILNNASLICTHFTISWRTFGVNIGRLIFHIRVCLYLPTAEGGTYVNHSITTIVYCGIGDLLSSISSGSTVQYRLHSHVGMGYFRKNGWGRISEVWLVKVEVQRLLSKWEVMTDDEVQDRFLLDELTGGRLQKIYSYLILSDQSKYTYKRTHINEQTNTKTMNTIKYCQRNKPN